MLRSSRIEQLPCKSLHILRPTDGEYTNTEQSFLNLVKSNQIRIVITLFLIEWTPINCHTPLRLEKQHRSVVWMSCRNSRLLASSGSNGGPSWNTSDRHSTMVLRIFTGPWTGPHYAKRCQSLGQLYAWLRYFFQGRPTFRPIHFRPTSFHPKIFVQS